MNFNATGSYHQGVSLLGGWLPLTVEIVTVAAVLAVVGWRSARWRLLWLPLCVAIGAAGALIAHWYMDSQGLSSDPAPTPLWIWVAVGVGSVAVAVFGWRGSRWWRRGLSLLAIPLSLLCVGLVLNQWVGYYPTVAAAWGAATAGPLPDQVSADELPGLRDTTPSTGKVVPVDIPDTASGFTHRTEYVYLPPAWFAGAAPPTLPAVMMIAGEFNTPADWMRSGNITSTVDAYANSHGGQAPILVFVDAGGSFNNDTECVDGPRGDAADHLTADVRPYVVSTFGASASPANWGVIGWSMGGTCAVDLTVMHPELFSSFVDIAGDLGPTSGTKEQTVDRLYGGNASAWAKFDPTTVMAAHGPYTGVSGLFEDNAAPPRRGNPGNWHPHPQSQTNSAGSGYGGQDGTPDTDEAGAADALCKSAAAQQVSCEVHTSPGGHTWQFATAALTDGLPWLAARIGIPHATTAPPPTS
ncbi:alpha/beta hydrolase [Rhodococcus sp. NPDC127528]|uniref:alpha/beta hydrolase n=1 Tax=unclassified Rhodococcus (in: high G+C Gram-positive bacteria) TaxID=192944 RepID=UPI00363E65D8